ncbi:HAD family hydrolase [Nocardioides sp. NPDC051685]|uniref:HAD family hydrolase n=1 Tax=Nocardioides sp. NPDC051685 TaxID=3364334 RepID=UPI0037A5A937
MIDAVIFDLFGTLVDAPTHGHRTGAVAELARAAHRPEDVVDAYLSNSWTARHDGTLATVGDLAEHCVVHTGSCATVDGVAQTWRALATARLVPDPTVIAALQALRDVGVEVGLISDAGAEVAEAWPDSPLAGLVDHAVFSCTSHAIKPAPDLYLRALSALGAESATSLYVGDGGGDELHGAETLGISAIKVMRRGGDRALAYGESNLWAGPVIAGVEELPGLVRVGA